MRRRSCSRTGTPTSNSPRERLLPFETFRFTKQTGPVSAGNVFGAATLACDSASLLDSTSPEAHRASTQEFRSLITSTPDERAHIATSDSSCGLCADWRTAEITFPLFRRRIREESADKPDSVPACAGGDHLSGTPIARRLARPTWDTSTGRRWSLLGLAPGGACLAAPVTWCAGELLPHRFTLASHNVWAVCSLLRLPRVTTPGRYPAPCPAESGLSSPKGRGRLADSSRSIRSYGQPPILARCAYDRCFQHNAPRRHRPTGIRYTKACCMDGWPGRAGV